MKFELHTVESAPEAVKPDLESAEKSYGSIPLPGHRNWPGDVRGYTCKPGHRS